MTLTLRSKLCAFLRKSLKLQLNLFMCCMVSPQTDNKEKPGNK